ncbi:MAG: hypothetical protein JWN07_412 [Hyphomicrobiales bacterium]|nr:hypothetical protein [Hyphomicrobiales bacterium]
MPEHRAISVTGIVEDVFAHRMVLRTDDGKVLIDLTPKGMEKISLKPGDKITIEGEQKPSEVKVSRVTQNGMATEIHHPEKPHDPKHHAHDPATALKSVRAGGYEVIGKPRGKPKHFEVLARRDGGLHELHVELDGHIRKAKPVQPHDQKWADELR